METDTNLSAWGTSRAVRIPKKMCEQTGIGVGSRLRVKAGEDVDGSYILIRPAEAHRSYGDAPYASLDEIFAGYTGNYQPTEFDWGPDVGAEVVP
jgi:antitoxin MazE